jgi:nicotinamidase/pyrazinamidase
MEKTTIDPPSEGQPAVERSAVGFNARYTATTALVVVDVQNDFADPKGSLSVEGAEALIPVINREVRRATSSHALVVATQDWHPESTPHFQKDGGIWPVHCVGGTWGAQLHPDLRLPEDAHTIRKGVHGEDGYSGFTTRDPISGEERPTALDRLLRDHGTTRVVVIGLATDYCVQATALDAARLGYDAAVLIDACAAVDLEAGDGDRALRTMQDANVALLRTRMR